MPRPPVIPKIFQVGVNYWPRVAGIEMWSAFDPDTIAREFAQIAALGLRGIRFFVRWDQFQPEPATVDGVMLDRLERFLTLAHEAGLHAIPTLFCGHIAGTNVLPRWALDPAAPPPQFPTIAGGERSPFGCGDLYDGPLLEAQRTFARAVGERLRNHPAIYAWDIGHEFSNVREPGGHKVFAGAHSTAPSTEAMVAAWGRSLATTLRDASGHGATAGTHADDVQTDRNLRLGSLCSAFAFASMQGLQGTATFARHRLDFEAMPFLAMLAASFSYKPVLVSGFGAVAGNERHAETEAAVLCTNVLTRLHADGRLGAYWWDWADGPHAEASGIVRTDGSEKPIAQALRDFAAEQRTVQRAAEMPMIAAVYYYRTLPSSMRTLFGAFLTFIEERRR
jgi:hypothetical protein